MKTHLVTAITFLALGITGSAIADPAAAPKPAVAAPAAGPNATPPSVAQPAAAGSATTDTKLPDYTWKDIDDYRLDGKAPAIKSGNFLTCLVSGTYDPDAWDKNRFSGQNRGNTVEGFKKQVSADAKDEDADGAKDADKVTQVEIVQWSWAKRARCQQSLGTTHAFVTGALALGYVLATDIHNEKPKQIGSTDLKRLGMLVLLPVMVDDLRAIGPTRRYYTSAVHGTSLISWRNEELASKFEKLTELQSSYGKTKPDACFVQSPTSFLLKTKNVNGIETLQSRVIVDIETYNTWCKSFRTSLTKIWALEAQKEQITDSFGRGRTLRWQEYSTLINNNGYSQQASTSRVLHKVITLPVTLVNTLVGTQPTEYQLDRNVQLKGTDAVELPILQGDYSFAQPEGDFWVISQTLRADLANLKAVMDSYKPDKKTPAAASLKADQASLATYESDQYYSNATTVSTYWYQAQNLISQINSLNTQRFVILDLESGTAYLAATSLEKVKSSTPVTPAPAVEPKPTT